MLTICIIISYEKRMLLIAESWRLISWLFFHFSLLFFFCIVSTIEVESGLGNPHTKFVTRSLLCVLFLYAMIILTIFFFSSFFFSFLHFFSTAFLVFAGEVFFAFLLVAFFALSFFGSFVFFELLMAFDF